MPHRPLPSDRIRWFVALFVCCLFGSAASGETYRILERTPDDHVTTRAAEAQEPRDGLDPITHHELFSTPVDEDHAQILWISSADTIDINQGSLRDGYVYPMVVSAHLPANSDLMYQLTSAKDGRLIDSFTHFRAGPDWSVDPARFALIAEGEYELHVSIRSPGRPMTRAVQRIDISGKASANQPDTSRPPRIPPDLSHPIGPVELVPLAEWELPEDGRIIYVSSSDGDDADNGRTPQTAVRTLDRGHALIREGRPDWLLLKRGDVFDLPHDENGEFRTWNKSGPSPLEPMIIGAYGDPEDDRPLLLSNGRGVLKYMHVSNLVIRDLHFYANFRDPDSRDYDGGKAEKEFGLHMVRAEDVVVQGCLFEYFQINVMLRQDRDPNNTRLRGIRMHRCVLRYAYNDEGGDAHGLYCKNVAGIVLTECVFDHNGWLDGVEDVYRTGRSHNIYFSDCTQMTVEGCVFARESYLSLKVRCEVPGWCQDVSIRNNLFLACAFPIDFGANGSDDEIYFDGAEIRGNVFARTTGWPVDAPRNLAVKISSARDVVVDSNLFIDNGPFGPEKNEAVRADATSALEGIVISNNDAFLPTPDGADMFSTHYRERRDEPGVRFINNRENIDPSNYFNAEVSVEGYLEAIGSQARSIDGLLDLIARQDADPQPQFTAAALLDYYRAGFTLRRGR